MLHTSAVPLTSSTHGRERRAQRLITKRNLQAAVLHGKKSKASHCPKTGRPRWMYTFADIVYITDETSTVEVTSWALEQPLLKVAIPASYLAKCEEAERRIARLPSIITSHTVLVVDMSRSMSKSDMNGHRSRCHGVYYNLAELYVAEALPPIETGLFSGKVKAFTDVVTLIEMRDGPTVVFERQPISWMLFNQFIDRADGKHCRSHGNYMPSLEEGFRMLAKYSHPSCASTLFFFSDGKPSDLATGLTGKVFPRCLLSLFASQCPLYAGLLSFSAFGFGHDPEDFPILQELVKAAAAAGAKASFNSGYQDDDILAASISNTLCSTIGTRNMLTRLAIGGTVDRTRTDAIRASVDLAPDQFAFNHTMWRYYNAVSTEHCTVRRVELRWIRKAYTSGVTPTWVEVPFQHSSATGVAVSNAFFGEGAERVVFLMTEINANNEAVGAPLVAKVSLFKHKEKDLVYLRRWHKTFLKTQEVASNLAGKFNQALDRQGVSKCIPRVMFLPCCIYEGEMGSGDHKVEFAFLSESRLDPNQYLKWNNNTGGVDGVMRKNAVNFEPLALALGGHGRKQATPMAMVTEGNEDEDDETELHMGPLDGSNSLVVAAPHVKVLEQCVLETDVPQAFSHFSYRYTNREKLICDLQGVLVVENGFPLFKWTDPCIHSMERRFGLTDHADEGFNSFFKTHQCNKLCELLGIANSSLNT